MIINLGIDAGNYMGKIVGPYGRDEFRTPICDDFERDIEETFGQDDMKFEIDGQKGFAGSIAAIEDEFGGVSMFGDSKAHDEAKIRILLAIYRYRSKYCPEASEFNIVTGQPIKTHKQDEKIKIKSMLEKSHEYTVNGEEQVIYIRNVAVAPEGSGAFWADPHPGKVRIIDIGSGTVNAATIIDKRHVNTASTTFNFGVETVQNKEDLNSIAKGIIKNTTKLKWEKNDKVLVCGGVSEKITPFIKSHYQNVEVIRPKLRKGLSVEILSPVFANSVGFYELSKVAFQ